MQQEETRNLILAMGLMFLVAIGYQFFVLAPAQEQYRAEQEAAEITKLEETSDPTVVGIAEEVEKISVDEALEGSERVSFDSASLDGSIRLKGSRLDDLNLKDYYQTLERKNEIRLFRPAEAEHGYYATYYWMKDGATPIAGPSSVWTQTGGKQLSESSPITLEISKGDYAITREISIDQDYMFTFKDTVTNTGSTPVTAFPYGSIVRYGEQEGFVAATDPGSGNAGYLAHMGLMGVMDGKLKLKKYGGLFGLKKIKGENARRQIATESGGWWGLSDKYWLGALIPDQTEPFFGAVNNELIAKEGPLEIQTRTQTARSLNPGESITVENRIFAGAKRLDVLRGYQKDLGVPKMIDAIDWGWAHFLTKPFFFMCNS